VTGLEEGGATGIAGPPTGVYMAFDETAAYVAVEPRQS